VKKCHWGGAVYLAYPVCDMPMLMRVQMPLEPFSSAVRDGSVGKKMQKIMEAIKPEAAYFTAMNGCRGGVLVVDMKDSSDIPKLAEPWFLTFNATVEFQPTMTPEDLGIAVVGWPGVALPLAMPYAIVEIAQDG